MFFSSVRTILKLHNYDSARVALRNRNSAVTELDLGDEGLLCSLLLTHFPLSSLSLGGSDQCSVISSALLKQEITACPSATSEANVTTQGWELMMLVKYIR